LEGAEDDEEHIGRKVFASVLRDDRQMDDCGTGREGCRDVHAPPPESKVVPRSRAEPAPL
jgi:hypothetical protein